jgi:hypothetical protein
MDGTIILSKIVQNLDFWDSINFLPISLKSMTISFYLTCKMRYYTHFFNTTNNLDYVGPYPEPKPEYISGDERTLFLEWYEK